MRCRRFKFRLARFFEMTPGTREHEAMLEHARHCPACTRELRAEEQLRTHLERLPKPEMPVHVRERILERALAERKRRRLRRLRISLGAAGAGLATACAATFLAIWLLPARSPSAAASVPQVALMLHKPREVGFVFHVRQPIRNARIVVRLPSTVAIDGRRTRQVAWRVNLDRGDNLLKLPLVAMARGGGIVSAEVDVAGSGNPLAKVLLMTHTRDAPGVGPAVPAGASGV